MVTARANWSLRDSRLHGEGEVRKLMSAAKASSLRDYALLGICYNAAMRVCELVHLKVGDFDFKHGFVNIIPAKRTHLETITRNGRTVVSERALADPIQYPLALEVARLISRWVRREKLSKNDWVFPGTSSSCQMTGIDCPGGHLSKREAQRIYHKIASTCGLDRAFRGIHSLKHTRLIEFAKKTKDPWFVRDAGRLASVVTSDVYVQHVTMSEKIASIGGKV